MQLHGNSGSDRRLSVGRVFWALTRWARALRFWVFVLLAVLAWFGVGEAQAATACPSDREPLCTRAAAYADAKSQADVAAQTQCNVAGGGEVVSTEPNHVAGVDQTGNYNPRYHCKFGTNEWVGSVGTSAAFHGGCPVGQSWNDATKKCDCPNGSVAQADGSCKSCADLNGEPGSPAGQGVVSRPFKSRCVGGCTLAMTDGWCTSTGSGSAWMMCSGAYEYTGASCAANPPPPEGPEDPDADEPPQEPPQTCRPAGAGQTFCVKPNGDQCATASTGKQICWKPGQTGRQNSGDTAQTRTGGTQPPATPPKAPDGSDMTPSGDGITTTTTETGGGRSVTTIINNYTTGNGQDAGDTDDGEPADGSGSSGGGGGGDDDDGTSASGGGNCEQRPIVSDPALEMIANQAWATRCAVEAGNAANVAGDVGNCAAPFAVEGTSANAEKLRALRVQICGTMGVSDASEAQAAIDGLDETLAGLDGEDPDVSSQEFEDAADPNNFREVRDLNAQLDQLDDSGFITNRSCPVAPTVSVAGGFIGLNFEPFCNMFINMSGLLMALAYIVGARIIAGVK